MAESMAASAIWQYRSLLPVNLTSTSRIATRSCKCRRCTSSRAGEWQSYAVTASSIGLRIQSSFAKCAKDCKHVSMHASCGVAVTFAAV